jgi:phosphomannomutase
MCSILGNAAPRKFTSQPAHLKVGGGICVTASHNPKDYNGMKFVRAESKPISGDSGLKEIQAKAEADDFVPAATRGGYESVDTSVAYVDHLLSYVT